MRSALAAVLVVACQLHLFCASPLMAQTVTESTAHSFSGADGSNPQALLQAKDGNFYGVGVYGGSGTCGSDPGKSDNQIVGCGLVFRLNASGTVTAIYTFSGSDGSFPINLMQGGDGNLYGTTAEGGSGSCGSDPGQSDNVTVGCGTIFTITSAGFKSLYSFSDLDDGAIRMLLFKATMAVSTVPPTRVGAVLTV